MLAAVAVLPLGALFALLLGLALLGSVIWQKGPPLTAALRRQGVGLSAGAFLAYAAYMALLNVDLIWVNRGFAPEVAGSYATAVLLRRIPALLPGALLFVVYPRLVRQTNAGRSPDRLLVIASAAIVVPTLLLAVLFGLAGPWLVQLAFGPAYQLSGALLGAMGLAMVGYGMTALWLNLFLATRPGRFVRDQPFVDVDPVVGTDRRGGECKGQGGQGKRFAHLGLPYSGGTFPYSSSSTRLAVARRQAG